jgi:hypothetical protein
MPNRPRAPRTRLLRALTLSSTLALGACSAPSIDLAAWRAQEALPRAALERGALADELAEVERLRAQLELTDARALALALVAEHPDDVRALLAASIAESDGVLLLSAEDEDEDARNHAAASALDYAERATARGAESAGARGQLAWALGTTTHLKEMDERAGHAQRTQRAAEDALALDPEQSTALATLAILHLRLETLPWIARLMASGLPDSSLEDAETFARRAVAARPSREHCLILAKVLVESGSLQEAREVLQEALAQGERFPRDRVLEPQLRALHSDL